MKSIKTVFISRLKMDIAAILLLVVKVTWEVCIYSFNFFCLLVCWINDRIMVQIINRIREQSMFKEYNCESDIKQSLLEFELGLPILFSKLENHLTIS